MNATIVLLGIVTVMVFAIAKFFSFRPPKHHLPMGDNGWSKFYWTRGFFEFTWYPECLFCEHGVGCHTGSYLDCPDEK